jgi:hypothetical protein
MSTIRGFIMVVAVTMVTYMIIFRWLYPTSPSDHMNNKIASSSSSSSSPSLPEKYRAQLYSPSLTNSSMFDELFELQFRPLR